MLKRGTYKLKFSKETLNIFIREIYKDVFMAIPRETIQNAVDSYIEANRFEGIVIVGVPSLDNLVYSITDYGIGIDDTRWSSIFCKLFRSTKDYAGTELLGGFFGLGSKSPFIFADKIIYKTTYNHKLVVREQYPDLSYKLLEAKENVNMDIETTVEVPISKEKLLVNYSSATGLSSILINKILELQPDIEPLEVALTVFNFWLAYYALGILYLPYDFKVLLQTEKGTIDLAEHLQAEFYKGRYLVKSSVLQEILLQKTLELVLPNPKLSVNLSKFVRDHIAKGKTVYPVIVGTLPYPNLTTKLHELTDYINSLQEADITIVLPKSITEVTPDRESVEIVSADADALTFIRQDINQLQTALRNREAEDKKHWTDIVLAYYAFAGKDQRQTLRNHLSVIVDAYDRTIVLPTTLSAEIKDKRYNIYRNNQLLNLLANMVITIEGESIEIAAPKGIMTVEQLLQILDLYKITVNANTSKLSDEEEQLIENIIRLHEMYNGDYLAVVEQSQRKYHNQKVDLLYWPTIDVVTYTAYKTSNRIVQFTDMKQLKGISRYLNQEISNQLAANTLTAKTKALTRMLGANGLVNLLAIQNNKHIFPVIIPIEELSVDSLYTLTGATGKELVQYVTELVNEFKRNYDEILASLLFKIDHYAADIPLLKPLAPKYRKLTPKSTINLLEDLMKVQGKKLVLYPIFRWSNVYKLLEALTV